MRKHAWTIVTARKEAPTVVLNAFENLTIVGEQSSFKRGPGVHYTHEFTTFDPITANQSHLKKVASMHTDIISLTCESVELVDPGLMTDQERAYLIATFEGIAHQFEAIEQQLIALQDLFPGLNLVSMSLHAREGQEESEQLSDYIEAAHDEQWKQKG